MYKTLTDLLPRSASILQRSLLAKHRTTSHRYRSATALPLEAPTSPHPHLDNIPLNSARRIEPKELRLYTRRQIPAVLNAYLDDKDGVNPLPFMAAASVLPMRANNYVCDELIDWSNIPDDPIFQLVFPQPGMLVDEDLARVQDLIVRNVSPTMLRAEVEKIRQTLNPHPAKQKELNVPRVGGEIVAGMQHKYRETALFFPSEGQYCQAFCTYCFRWAQFTAVGSDQQFQSTDAKLLCDYLAANPCISDLLFTGGDPMVMTSRQWKRYLEAILSDRRLDQLATIRIGSKSLAYWPYRFLTDKDADDILRLFEKVVQSGRHLAFMAHFSHPRELSTPAVQEAIRRIRMTGATIRSQAPLIRHVNDDATVWAHMWRLQVRLGVVPYYMFVERDTGSKHYFEVPLVEGLEIYNKASTAVSGVGRTVRGPSMSHTSGKVHVVGTATVAGEKVFVLKFLQARNPQWTHRVFFAKFDPQASWMDDLRPAFGGDRFFFEDELEGFESAETSSGGMFPYSSEMDYVNGIL